MISVRERLLLLGGATLSILLIVFFLPYGDTSAIVNSIHGGQEYMKHDFSTSSMTLGQVVRRPSPASTPSFPHPDNHRHPLSDPEDDGENSAPTTYGRLSSEHGKGHPAVNAKEGGDFRLLIGVMSPFWALSRRQMVRQAYSRLLNDLPVDIVFVEGNMSAAMNQDRVQSMQHTVIKWENSTYHDIMHLDCKENMNEGKTYQYLKKVGTEFAHKYTHVMKTDDDAFVNIPGISPCSFPSHSPSGGRCGGLLFACSHVNGI